MAQDQRQVSTSEQLITTVAQLDETQKAKLLEEAENIRAGKASTVEVAEQWANVGANLGKGLAATAREMGMALNEFANSRVGTFAMVLIAWNFLGGTIMHLLTALSCLLLLFGWYRVFRNVFGVFDDKRKLQRFDMTDDRNDIDGIRFILYLTPLGLVALFIVSLLTA